MEPRHRNYCSESRSQRLSRGPAPTHALSFPAGSRIAYGRSASAPCASVTNGQHAKVAITGRCRPPLERLRPAPGVPIEPSALYLAKYLLRFARAYSLAQTCSTPVSIRSTRCERGSSSKSGSSSASCPSAESERVVSDRSEPSPPDPESPCKAPASRLSLRLVAYHSAWFDPRCAHRSTSGFVQLRANQEAALETIMETTQPLTKTGTSDVTVR
jgi:hypothetical protein